MCTASVSLCRITLASAATRLARRLPLRSVFVFSQRLCVASGVTGAGDGCKPCLVADCGVYGLPISTSRQHAISCAWPPGHRAFPTCPPEQPRPQTFRTRGGEAWHPQRGRGGPATAGRSAAQQVVKDADTAKTWRPAIITLFSFKSEEDPAT